DEGDGFEAGVERQIGPLADQVLVGVQGDGAGVRVGAVEEDGVAGRIGGGGGGEGLEGGRDGAAAPRGGRAVDRPDGGGEIDRHRGRRMHAGDRRIVVVDRVAERVRGGVAGVRDGRVDEAAVGGDGHTAAVRGRDRARADQVDRLAERGRVVTEQSR